MSDDSSIHPASGATQRDPGALRTELAQVRAEAEEELVRLREELSAVRELARPSRDVEEVTETLALQQELDILRQTLREKERVVDVTAGQCRRLEDELEDQRLAYDELKQDLERKRSSLAEAREQTGQLVQERQEIEERYKALLMAAPVTPPAAEQPMPWRKIGGGPPPLVGIAAGVAVGLALGVATTLMLRSDEAPPPHPPVASAPARPATEPPPAAPEPKAAIQESEPGTADELPDIPPTVLRSVRDRLSDGSPGPLMVALSSGRFTMGKVRALPSDDEGPSRQVEVASFLIGATEITFEDYDRFVRATGGRFPSDFGWGRGRQPVVDLSWIEARAYADWLTRQTGQRYRLPSEAEWEYAAGAGLRSPFWWGFQAEQGRAVCFDCGTLWDNRATAPVGTFEPNPLGLYDTAGNAMEWVDDCYHPTYTGAPADARPWVEAGCQYRIARGGAFNKPANSMRSTARQRMDPSTRHNFLGFRLARDS
ncbi:MAG: SUMF1/EgtB/PvdO family nonheme iron enzyme [Chromatiaceae bacterium]|jgi:formylglycine-generating enzyme required for sulfatase activity|nr:SUMF1/EgtB/PvdO family nonheme iron enzyme [Chromatiaceae bacterium]